MLLMLSSEWYGVPELQGSPLVVRDELQHQGPGRLRQDTKFRTAILGIRFPRRSRVLDHKSSMHCQKDCGFGSSLLLALHGGSWNHSGIEQNRETRFFSIYIPPQGQERRRELSLHTVLSPATFLLCLGTAGVYCLASPLYLYR